MLPFDEAWTGSLIHRRSDILDPEETLSFLSSPAPGLPFLWLFLVFPYMRSFCTGFAVSKAYRPSSLFDFPNPLPRAKSAELSFQF